MNKWEPSVVDERQALATTDAPPSVEIARAECVQKALPAEGAPPSSAEDLARFVDARTVVIAAGFGTADLSVPGGVYAVPAPAGAPSDSGAAATSGVATNTSTAPAT